MTDLRRPASLADLRVLLAGMPGPDHLALRAAASREPLLTKPPGSLGRLEQTAAWLATWQGRHPPTADRIAAVVFAGNHGVAAQGVSAFPAAVTAQMVANFQAGGAAINQLCRTFGVDLAVEALALDQPTADFTQGPAMDEGAFLTAIGIGMGSVQDGLDALCIGEMGIANTTAASAVCLGLFGGTGLDWTGPGTGIAGAVLAHKARIVEAGVARNRPAMGDGLGVLCSVGGRELAAMAGAILAARLKQIPVVLDGFVCTAAAAALEAVQPGALDHCVVGHVSAEPGHARLLERLGKAPLLSLGMRLGEASGAVLAVAVLKAACACHAGMATFAEAGVSSA